MVEGLPPRVLFFDGVCVMCNRIVERLLRIDKARQFHFASLQGETAGALRARHSEMPSALETMVYVENGSIYVSSTGVLRALRQVPYPYKALSWLRVLPTSLTDRLYRLVARSRYRVFGTYETCPLPPVEDRARFLP